MDPEVSYRVPKRPPLGLILRQMNEDHNFMHYLFEGNFNTILLSTSPKLSHCFMFF
jgi:hypothetical protein